MAQTESLTTRAWPQVPAAGDIAMTLAALLLAAALTIGAGPEGVADRILVDVDGATEHEVAVGTDRTLHIAGPLGVSVVRIASGRARFESAPCRGQICVAQGWLEHPGDVAACVPNRLVLRVLGDAPPLLDGVTR